jgi:hypothetical protein
MIYLVGGWPTLWKMMEFVSWDDDIPNIWKVIKFMFQTTNQLLHLHLNIYITTVDHDNLFSSSVGPKTGYWNRYFIGLRTKGFGGWLPNINPHDGRQGKHNEKWKCHSHSNADLSRGTVIRNQCVVWLPVRRLQSTYNPLPFFCFFHLILRLNLDALR